MGRNPESIDYPNRARRIQKRWIARTRASLISVLALQAAIGAPVALGRLSEPTPAYSSSSSAENTGPGTTVTIFEKPIVSPTTTTSEPKTTTTIPKTTTTTRRPTQPTVNASGESIPPNYLRYYRESGKKCVGLDWSILAAIGEAETNHGRDPNTNIKNSYGALGPMQFLESTWAGYKTDGNNDGIRDVLEPADAIAGAANYLCASGLAEQSKSTGNTCPSVNGRISLKEALYSYNRSCRYVAGIIAQAQTYSEQYPA